MRDFTAINFETANPQRVSACAIGYARVSNGQIVESNRCLIKPVGGHTRFLSVIHGIKEEHTRDRPDFGELYPEIKDLFSYPLVAHGLFDKQVLDALAHKFNLSFDCEYYDSNSIAKIYLPHLKDHKLSTLGKYFHLPEIQEHDATMDAVACAQIFMKIQGIGRETQAGIVDERSEFKGLVEGILADDEVNYKEAYQLLYWVEDHIHTANEHIQLRIAIQEFLADDYLDDEEAAQLKSLLQATLRSIQS